MKIAKHPFLIGMICIATAVYVTSLLGFQLPHLISDYLNDLLCMPIVLSLCLAALRLMKKDNQIYITPSMIIVLTLYYAFHFEWLLPRYMVRYTSDAIDVLLYIIGAIVFYRIQKQLF
jgi:hypothetical protein